MGFLLIFLYENFVKEIFKELLLVFSNEPLIKWDVETSVPLVFDDFLFESCSTIESFSISGEMMETMDFDDKMLKRVKFGDVNITNYVIEIVLKERRDTKLKKMGMNLFLNLWYLDFMFRSWEILLDFIILESNFS